MRWLGITRTPHDGDHVDAEITWHKDHSGRWIISVGADEVAYLHRESHRLWTLNPGLRDRVVQGVRADTLVGA